MAGTRTCFVVTIDGRFAGYVTVNWRPTYAGFADLNIPEIQDLNVLTTYRRKGIASRLLDRAEAEVARRSGVVGIGVGLHPGYNAAQRLYVKRGYIPDARGITYRERFVEEGAYVVLEDELVIHFTKAVTSAVMMIRCVAGVTLFRSEPLNERNGLISRVGKTQQITNGSQAAALISCSTLHCNRADRSMFWMQTIASSIRSLASGSNNIGLADTSARIRCKIANTYSASSIVRSMMRVWGKIHRSAVTNITSRRDAPLKRCLRPDRGGSNILAAF
jgi:GNAT superfamily N-acetyltransferase